MKKIFFIGIVLAAVCSGCGNNITQEEQIEIGDMKSELMQDRKLIPHLDSTIVLLRDSLKQCRGPQFDDMRIDWKTRYNLLQQLQRLQQSGGAR